MIKIVFYVISHQYRKLTLLETLILEILVEKVIHHWTIISNTFSVSFISIIGYQQLMTYFCCNIKGDFDKYFWLPIMSIQEFFADFILIMVY